MLFEMLKATFFFLIAAFTVGHCLPIREPGEYPKQLYNVIIVCL